MVAIAEIEEVDRRPHAPGRGVCQARGDVSSERRHGPISVYIFRTVSLSGRRAIPGNTAEGEPTWPSEPFNTRIQARVGRIRELSRGANQPLHLATGWNPPRHDKCLILKGTGLAERVGFGTSPDQEPAEVRNSGAIEAIETNKFLVAGRKAYAHPLPRATLTACLRQSRALPPASADLPPSRERPTLDSVRLRHLGAGLHRWPKGAAQPQHPGVDGRCRSSMSGSRPGGLASLSRRPAHRDRGRRPVLDRGQGPPSRGHDDQKRRELLEGKLLSFCADRGHRQLRDLTVERLREFRHGWTYSRPLGSQAAGVPTGVPAFLRRGWLDRAEPGSGAQTVQGAPQADAALHRCRGGAPAGGARALVGFGQRRAPDRGDDLAAPATPGYACRMPRVSSARVSTATSCSSTSRRPAHLCAVRCRRSWCRRSTAVARPNERYFFYDGTSQPESMVKSWDRVFRKVGETADAECDELPPASLPRHVRGLAPPERGCRSTACRSCSATARSRSPSGTTRRGSRPDRIKLESEVRRIWS